VPEAFIILAHAEARARHGAEAARAYRRYLELAPRAPDAPFVQGIVGRAP